MKIKVLIKNKPTVKRCNVYLTENIESIKRTKAGDKIKEYDPALRFDHYGECEVEMTANNMRVIKKLIDVNKIELAEPEDYEYIERYANKVEVDADYEVVEEAKAEPVKPKAEPVKPKVIGETKATPKKKEKKTIEE